MNASRVAQESACDPPERKASYSCALSLVRHDAHLGADQVQARLSVHEEVVHSTIEIRRCDTA